MQWLINAINTITRIAPILAAGKAVNAHAPGTDWTSYQPMAAHLAATDRSTQQFIAQLAPEEQAIFIEETLPKSLEYLDYKIETV